MGWISKIAQNTQYVPRQEHLRVHDLMYYRSGSDGFALERKMVKYMAASQLIRTLTVLYTQVHQSPPRTDKLIVGQAIEKNVEVLVQVVAGNSAFDYDASFTGEIKAIDELLSPVSQIEAGTVRCVGLNYKEHAAEMKLTLPNTPTLVYLLPLLTLADTV
jgi:hypothetical protein